MLCDIYHPDGRPVPYSTRQIGRDAVARLADSGYDYLCGLEVEFHILKLEDPKLQPGQAGQPGEPPDVSLLTHGYQYLTEFRMDELEPVVEIIRRDILELGLPLRSIEVEYGPSQCEFTFQPRLGIESADNMVLFRSAVKQICRRHGYHGTFMCRPKVRDLFSCGWHLHQSLYDRKTLQNAFMPRNEAEILSPVGLQYVAGLLGHAAAACVFTTPTINGYKRYQPYSLAPVRAHWAYDNKGAMVRALGGAGDPGSRVENRIGEPAANPYLYLASQIHSGLDGIERALVPPPPDDSPYASDAPRLPASLMESLAALRESKLFRSALGDEFVDYVLTLKEAEVSRFLSEVTDWEQREYFEIF
jgi:glutamine synthetase